MGHGREWWSQHVAEWRSSGLTQAEYSRRHGITEGSLRRWSSRLKGEAAGADLVEIKSAAAAGGGSPLRAIELVVQGRYLLRLWPGTDSGHLRQVLSVLEQRQ
jgi:transposase-like protein